MARILLGVTGGIAAYKVIDLASKLTQRGDTVIPLLTPSAQKFVTPLTFRAVTRQRVYTDTFEDVPDANTEHISLAEGADLLVVAPATADFMGKAAHGLGDDILTVTLLAYDGKVLIAPAMNDKMWANPLVKKNTAILKECGFTVLEPDSGHLACGSVGPGRLPETEDLLTEIDKLLKA